VVASDVAETIPGVTQELACGFLMDLLEQVVLGQLEPGKLDTALAAAGLTKHKAASLPLMIADAVWMAWAELELEEDPEKRSRLRDAVQQLLRNELVTRKCLMMTGEGEFLEEVGLVVSRDAWRRKEIRTNTKHVYQQRKYNLLREESEGWAKLVTLLNQSGAGKVTEANAGAVAPETKQLALPLLILLAQQKRLITLQAGYSHLKLVAELYDSCQETLLQYIDFLQTAQTPTQYAALLPSIQSMVDDYLIEPEVVFQLVRPMVKAAAVPPRAALAPSAAASTAAGEEGELEEGEAGPTEAGPMEADSAAEEGALPVANGALPVANSALPVANSALPVANGALPVANGAAAGVGGTLAGILPEVERLMASQATFRALSPLLYAVFWTRTLDELELPHD
ncbi:hypothetical protein APUTEX25_005810, partial [Auxenochlorella protothecoides]